MGYALFTARKMSLQSKVNQYNLQLMKLANEENKLTQQSSLRQKMNNAVDNAQNTGSMVAKGGGTVAGAIAGFAVGGPIGALVGSSLGNSASDVASGLFNHGIDQGQNASDEAYQTQLAAKQQQIDTEKQRLNTLLTAAQAELKTVEEAEKKAIDSSAPSYVA